jgi:hypothetical protein
MQRSYRASNTTHIGTRSRFWFSICIFEKFFVHTMLRQWRKSGGVDLPYIKRI